MTLLLRSKHRTDYHRRNKFARTEMLSRVIKVINFRKTVTIYPRAFCKTARIKNLCPFSGRTRGMARYGLARQTLKDLATKGGWLGLKKCSW